MGSDLVWCFNSLSKSAPPLDLISCPHLFRIVGERPYVRDWLEEKMVRNFCAHRYHLYPLAVKHNFQEAEYSINPREGFLSQNGASYLHHRTFWFVPACW